MRRSAVFVILGLSFPCAGLFGFAVSLTPRGPYATLKQKNHDPPTMSRPGKIARLPYDIREQVNCRLRDGEPAKPILQWLNQLSEVRAILDSDFAGSPISKQSLADWKLHAFRA